MSARWAKTTPDKARELQRTLYRAAKASPTRRFHALYDKMYREDVLAKAWREVKANAGSVVALDAVVDLVDDHAAVRVSQHLRRAPTRPAESARLAHQSSIRPALVAPWPPVSPAAVA